MKYFICLILSLQFSSAANANFCAAHLNQFDSPDFMVTENFIAYISILIKNHIVPVEYLPQLIQDIQQDRKISHPIIDSKAVSTQIPHQTSVLTYLEHPSLDKKKVLSWALATWDLEQQTKAAKKDSWNQTVQIIEPMVFSPVKPATMNPEKDLFVIIKRKIEVMQTHVTQAMWLEFMGVNPAHFNKGLKSLNHPVENITWWSAVVFANRVSAKKGLLPAYDLSQIKDWEGNPKKGDYRPKNIEAAKKLIRINAPKNNIYATQGYRLPTYGENLLVATNRARNKSLYFSEQVRSRIKEYAWYEDNSEDGTQPVATLLPYNIDEEQFFDLHGNVGIWLHDWAKKKDETENINAYYGVEPQCDFNDPELSSDVIQSNGAWNDNTLFLRSGRVFSGSSAQRTNGIGIRLVRSLPK